MGTVGRKVAGKNVDEIISLMNKALADEWLAVYQYWVGARVIKGPMRSAVEKELLEHSEEEKKHADMLADRIIKLGGTPIIDFKDLSKMSTCGYDAPDDESVKAILVQNIKGERCAIEVYKKILDKLKGTDDYVTFNMIRKIMEDEIDHEDELESLLDDMKMMK